MFIRKYIAKKYLKKIFIWRLNTIKIVSRRWCVVKENNIYLILLLFYLFITNGKLFAFNVIYWRCLI